MLRCLEDGRNPLFPAPEQCSQQLKRIISCRPSCTFFVTCTAVLGACSCSCGSQLSYIYVTESCPFNTDCRRCYIIEEIPRWTRWLPAVDLDAMLITILLLPAHHEQTKRREGKKNKLVWFSRNLQGTYALRFFPCTPSELQCGLMSVQNRIESTNPH